MAPKYRNTLKMITGAVLVVVMLAGCLPSIEDLEAIVYAPLAGGDWPVSTPEAQGLNPLLVAALYHQAARTETTNSVLVVKNGKLIAEGYFNDGAIDFKNDIASVTKSFTSALVGIAIDQGCLTGVDQKMMEFFPELADQVSDARKNEITIQQMLQMRAGYPWEESSAALFDLMYYGWRASTLVDVPLIRDPGSGFDYSNLSSHLLAIIVARACNTDLKPYAQEHLLSPIGAEVGDWIYDWEYHRIGHAGMYLTARDLAKFGLLYLADGVWEGEQVVPGWWVRQSLQTYTEDAWGPRVGKNFTDMGYGYQWWSGRAGDHEFNFAWGHGGQVIALVAEYNMVIVVTADPLYEQHGGDSSWKHEKENLNLVGDFISTLP